MIWFGRHADLGRHFSGASTRAGDRRLFHHLKTCDACRDQYRTLALLEELEGNGGERARTRLGRGLFEARSPRPALVSAGLAVAFACAALVFSVGRMPAPFHSTSSTWSGFTARGGLPAFEAPQPSLAIYRVPRDRNNPELLAASDTQRAGSIIHAGESLAFSYVNPEAVGASFVMIFARNAEGRIFWFWPAWDKASDDPQSLPIAQGPSSVELREAVRHELQPGELTIVGLFTPKPLHVHEVEAAVANGLQGLQAFPGHVWTETLEVSR
ncbi:MAG TPA: hypothetical protein VH560_01895 [Polyangia bacterium]|jgi:hypothetical protein|nr:hypothetical protein [Polyangia bacterium]